MAPPVVTPSPPLPGESAGAPPREDQVRSCCEAVGLDPYRDAERVTQIFHEGEESVETCCDSGCDPCVDTLISAVRLLRQRTK